MLGLLITWDLGGPGDLISSLAPLRRVKGLASPVSSERPFVSDTVSVC